MNYVPLLSINKKYVELPDSPTFHFKELHNWCRCETCVKNSQGMSILSLQISSQSLCNNNQTWIMNEP